MSELGLPGVNVVSKLSSVEPSKVKLPVIVPPKAIVSVAASPSVNVPPLNVVVPVTVRLPSTVALPSIVTLAPLIVIAAVELLPDLMTNSPELFVNLPNSVPPSCNTMSAPSASKFTSPALSKVIDDPVIVVITGLVKVLFVSVSDPVNDTKLSSCNAVLNSDKVPVSVLASKSKVLFVNVNVSVLLLSMYALILSPE